MKNWIVSVTLGISLAGCAQVEGLFGPDASGARTKPAANASPDAVAAERSDPLETSPVPVSAARTAEGFDTSTESQRAEAVAAAQTTGGAADLGVTIASVVVDLIPLDASPGAGSQISLAAMRLIEADLTGLPELRVFRLPD